MMFSGTVPSKTLVSQVVKPSRESVIVRLLREIASEMGLEFATCSGNWGILLTNPANQQTKYVWGYSFGLNNQATAKYLDDKAMLSDVLAIKKIPHVEHQIFLSSAYPDYVPPSGSMGPLLEFAKRFNYEVVLKPKDGTGGMDVTYCKNARDVEGAAIQLWQKGYGLVACPYEQVLNEYRAICLDGVVKLVFAKIRPSIVGDGRSTIAQLLAQKFVEKPEWLDLTKQSDNFVRLDFKRVLERGESCPIIWKHNLGTGAQVSVNIPTEIQSRVEELALLTVRALEARFVSIDIFEVAATSESDSRFTFSDSDGSKRTLLVIEGNSGVMMEKLAENIPGGVALAKQIYQEAVGKMFEFTPSFCLEPMASCSVQP